MLILASASPQRRRLLRKAGMRFKIVPSGVGENCRERNPRRLVALLARRKALAVAKRRPGDVVLGADTLVVCRGRIIGKPRNRAHARRILMLLNGSWQRVYTGVAVAARGGKRVRSAVVVSRVKARRLSEGELARYAGKHLDKAGAYAVQDHGDPFIERIEGPVDNVIGLPVEAAKELIAKLTR